MKAADKKDKGYSLYFLFDKPELEGRFLGAVPAIPYSIRTLRNKGIEYVVINGQLESVEKGEFIRKLDSRGRVVIDFSPYTENGYRETSDPTATTCIPATNKEIFSRKRQGPALRLFRIK